ncbi:MFS transporter [Burkholderia oklahomensis]|uniref:MFS transporter n=1 Tax=Burkholderia oklahomensis TaxID=342113 RepID=UPI00016A8A2A|nr:MFS transporter [Burkholderia oklahomensis]AJX34377.1 sugar (and other) transporter family protein [Burkholderia oklahomensis C6786]AOI48025.1 MFS transporter [Burkholderia oklahomensis C6786]KUY50105.1 MFS transporter [Burkholderia oklahomensis C6786]MBI0363860.1 MFS transporter [Burkholderia oklahomensis]SUY27987.1 Proline porter II [Burkholderia oklahomensis]
METSALNFTGAPADARAAAKKRRLIAAAAVGNALEFYDFTVYSFFAILIGKLFFPVHSSFGQLMLAVASFGVGFVTRPLGGLVIGMYADRVGRKRAMIATLLIMALGTATIAVAPTYAQAGIAAPLLLVIARLLQGFASGGEVGASTTLLIEQAPHAQRGFYASFQFSSQGLAALVGALTGVVLTSTLSAAQLESWGWRVPFVIGTLFAPLGYWLRRTVDEAPAAASSAATASRGNIASLPLADVLRRHGKAVFAGLGITIGGTSIHYIIVFYMAIYGVQVLHLPSWLSMMAGCIAGAMLAIVTPIGGYLSDRYGRNRIVWWTRIALMLAIYPAFVALNRWPGAVSLLTIIAALACVHAINIGAMSAMLGELFPRAVRATGGALVYSIGVAIFGGFAQFFVTWLIAATGDANAPAYYAIGCGALTLIALRSMDDKAGKPLD